MMLVASLLFATAAAVTPPARVADDVKAMQRIAEVSRRDFPGSVVKRIADDDVELLRGRRSDGTYEFAHYERQEASRASDRFAVRSNSEDKLARLDYSGEHAYRLIISVPSRRLLVARNRRVWIESVDFDYTPFGGTSLSKHVDVKSWIEVGEQKSIDVPEISRRVKSRVTARVDAGESGPATVELALIQARLVDNRDSPWFAEVQSMVALATAAEHNDAAGVKSLAGNLVSRVATSDASSMTVVARPCDLQPPAAVTAGARESMPQVEIYLELQGIEDLLTGSESERRDGIDKLHQLVRKLRPSSGADR